MKQKIKQFLRSAYYFVTDKNYRKIKRSGLFDPDYYQDRVPGLQNTGKNPLIHYVDFGSDEGKSPSPFFDPVFYEKTYGTGSVKDSFVHYLTTGVFAKHRPCKWFDPHFYQQQYLEQEGDTISPLKHYQNSGLWQGLYPNSDVFQLAQKPLLSIIVPVYNVSSLHLNNCIRSVLHQSYPHWEICLVDDCSTNSDVRQLLEEWAARDPRIKIDFFDENQGISGAMNAAVALATGKYLGFLDNDDELTNECLFKVVEKINSEEADLYYSDEDLIGEDGTQFSVFSKPDFNKELLLSHNYVTHFVVSEKTLYDKVGGFDRDFDGAQDFDLFLKLSEQAGKVVHIPEILYHWRASESSTSINHEQKQYADDAGRRAVEGALARRGIVGEVGLTDWKFFYRIQKELVGLPLVSIVVLYRGGDDFSKWFYELLSRTNYSHTEFVVIAESEQQLLSLKPLGNEPGRKFSLLLSSSDDTPAARYNAAVRKSSGQYVVFLNSWVQMQTSDWVEVMLGHAMEENSGVVGGRILPFQGDDFISTVPDLSQQSDVYYARFLQRCSQHMNGLQCVQNVLSLSWDLAMVKRECFLDNNGFAEESLGQLFADSDLCLRLRASGYENVYTPFVSGQWLMSEEKQISISSLLTRAEKTFFQKKWQKVLRDGDPYYNYGVFEQSGICQDDFLKWYAGDVI